MSIKIYNEKRLMRQSFFRELIHDLATEADISLRDIHQRFAHVENIDRQLDKYISAGWILRVDKRYQLGLPLFTDRDLPQEALSETLPEDQVQMNLYDAPFLVRADSRLCQLLDTSSCQQHLINATNHIVLQESSRYDRSTATISNYFYKVAEQLPLSDFEQEIYELVGDVDPDYALKYMTSFLLKFTEKECVKSKPDIFVTLLEKYGFVSADGDDYRLITAISRFDEVPSVRFDAASAFILAQIRQRTLLPTIITL
jgi:hypothetical protein